MERELGMLEVVTLTLRGHNFESFIDSREAYGNVSLSEGEVLPWT
jgi:hypothetical protein